MRELDGDNGQLQLPESTKMLTGVGDENDDSELDAGSLGSILLAETMSMARRSERDQPRLEASSTVAVIADQGGARVSGWNGIRPEREREQGEREGIKQGSTTG